jgi:hypothetical protein
MFLLCSCNGKKLMLVNIPRGRQKSKLEKQINCETRQQAGGGSGAAMEASSEAIER